MPPFLVTIAKSGNHNDWIHEFELKYGLAHP